MASPYNPITFTAPVAIYGIEGQYYAKTGKNTTDCKQNVETDAYNCNYTLVPSNAKVFDPLSKTGFSRPGGNGGVGNTGMQW